MIEEARCNCQRCGQRLEFPTSMDGQDIACPHCGKETTLFVPERYVHKAPGEVRRDIAADPRQIHLMYLLSVLMPLVGFFCGIYLLAKKKPESGVICLGLSVVCGAVWLCILAAVGG